jgi:hypothetical protein
MKPRVVCVKSVPVLGILGAALFAACAGGQEPQSDLPSDLLTGGDAFVQVQRAQAGDDAADIANAMSVLGTAAAGLTSGEDNFYLAVHRSALEQQWFLSAYMKQYHLGNAGVAAAASIGTRVVSFKVQNDKLYVFDSSDQFKVSELFDPDVVLEAYPIVHLDGFDRLPGAQDYVLVDPSAGLNQFQVTGDVYADPNLSDRGSLPLEVGLAYMQNFRNVSDGVTFEEVFSGQLDLTPFGGELSSAWGTLGVSIRAYQVGEGYVPTADPGIPHYFLSDSRFIPDSFQTLDANPVRWDLHPGREPIQVFITGGAQRAQADFPDVDILGALERGVEKWNDVIGYQAFDAVLVDDDEIRDDDKSTALIDYPGAGNGFAFADWRSNPNNGEILGGSVYFDGAFFTSLPLFEDDAVDLTPADRPAARPATYAFLWGGMPARRPACQLQAPDKLSHLVDRLRGDTSLTASEKGANFIQAVMAHEWGHVLGLRHNFKGSLVPPSSSLMEYSIDSDQVLAPEPGAYDVAAIQYLYQQSQDLPVQPFCTDEDLAVDPSCEIFDSGAAPLTDYWAPLYDLVTTLIVDEAFPVDFVDIGGLPELLGFARDDASFGLADPADRVLAAQLALGRIGVPIDPADAADPAIVGQINAMTDIVLHRMVLDPPELRGNITFDFTDPQVIALVSEQSRRMVVNEDGVRGFELRRTGVDVLKRLQDDAAFLELRTARDTIAAALADGTVAEADVPLTEDLLARIDAALSPYFD